MTESGAGRATMGGARVVVVDARTGTRSRRGARRAPADRSHGAIGCVVAVLCLGMAGAIAHPPESGPCDPARFEVTVLASGLVQPMELAVAGDGTVYWLELAGRLMALAPGAAAPAVVGELSVTTAQENGLIGLALDPAFTTTGWVYLQYSPPDFPGQRVSRFTIRAGRLDPASERILLSYEEQRKECCHHAGSLAFGPGGDLFIATGDNTHPHGDSAGYAPLDERPDRAPWDAQKSSANTRSHNGKILRIHPDPDGTASIPAGNLFPADGAAGLPEIYCMGCRNPWRIAVDSKTGTVYWGEVGPDAGDDGPRGSRGYDEINQARTAGNFGWPYFIADNRRYADHDFATDRSGALFDPEHPVNDSPNSTGSRDLPPARPALLFYPYGKSAEFPVLGEGGRTACAGPVYHAADHAGSATRFPDRYDNTLFIYDWTRHWIMAVMLDSQERVERIEPFMPHHPFVRPIDMAFGPGGEMYLIEYGDTWGVNANARLVRIDYVRGNRLPVAVAAGEDTVGRAPLTARFTSAGSGDRDGDPLEFRWRVQRTAAGVAEPPREAASGPQPTITFAEPGVYTVEMTATDPHGGSRTASVPVVVGNAPPRVRFAEPAEGDFLDGDRPLRFRLVVDDAEDGTTEDDRDDAEPLTSADVPRAGVRASFDTNAAAAVSPGLERMQRSDCFNCHAVEHARVGPPLLEIATKYRGQPGALEASVDRVLKGSAGVWGKVPMLAHGHHTPVEVREMVAWIFALEKTALPQVMQGFTGAIPLPAEALARAGRCRLEASYVDRGGAEGIPAAVGSATVTLRPRRIEAEAADAIDGPQILGSGNASAGRFVGAVDHGDTLVFRDIPLDTVGTMTLRLASAGAGGMVEVRIGAADGMVLARVPVEVNGQWEQFYERTVALPPTSGRHDVVVRFTHPGQAGGLLNIDTVSFDR